MVDLNDDIILIASDGVIIRMSAAEIRQCRRPSKGVRVMRLDDGAKIVAMARAPHEDPEEAEEEGEATAAAGEAVEAPADQTADAPQE